MPVFKKKNEEIEKIKKDAYAIATRAQELEGIVNYQSSTVERNTRESMGFQENITAIALNVFNECNDEYNKLDVKAKAIIKKAGNLYVELKQLELEVADEDFSNYNKYLQQVLRAVDLMNHTLTSLFRNLTYLYSKVGNVDVTTV